MLTLDSCPLLNPTDDRTQRILDLYNAAAKQLELLTATFPELVRSDAQVTKLVEELQRILRELQKKSYSIGFIGPTQSGKSTTVNYVLDATDPADQPCREGHGDNTTSTVSRIVRGERSVRLHYMSPEKFAQKRERLCQASGFDPASSDDDILRQADQRLADVRNGAAQPLPDGEQILEHDIIVLKALLTAYKRYHHELPRWLENIRNEPFASRTRFVNYGKGADEANPLLNEAIIGFDSNHLSERLQIFDLPGPGAKSSIDEWTTRQFLPQMDGIMLFLNCTRLGDESVERLFNELRMRFRERTSKRVWIVMTRWDGPTSAALDGEHSEKNSESVFTAIRKMLDEKQLPQAQMRFVCGPWYTANDESFVKTHFRSRLGSDRLPAGLQACPELQPHFEELFKRGGILSLRSLILEALPRDVCSEILESAETSLKRLRQEFLRRFENEVRRQTATAIQSATAAQFSTKMGTLVMDLESDLTTFEPHAVQLRQKLRQEFEKICAPAAQLDHFQSVPEDFPVHARTLQQQLNVQLESHLLPELFAAWQSRFDEFTGLLIHGPVSGEQVQIGDAWRELRELENSRAAAYAAQMPTFRDKRLFVASDDDTVAELRRGEAYRDMMFEKISLTAQQVVHFVRNQLVLHANALKNNLDQLTRTELDATPVAEGRFTGVLTQMKELAS